MGDHPNPDGGPSKGAWADASSDDESYYSRPARFGDPPKEKKPKKKGTKILQEDPKICQTHFVEPADSAGYDEVEFCGTGGKSPPPPSKEVEETRQAVKAQEQQLSEAQERADVTGSHDRRCGCQSRLLNFSSLCKPRSGQETPSGSGSVAEHMLEKPSRRQLDQEVRSRSSRRRRNPTGFKRPGGQRRDTTPAPQQSKMRVAGGTQ